MIPYRTPADIGNDALQCCGAQRMDPTLGFNSPGVNAAEVSFAYDKQRQGELKERYWTFAIKRAVLRARDDNMMLLQPALWSASTTYFHGSIVTDQSGNIWISNIAANTNNDPLSSNYWEPYCGPLGVPLYSSTETYSSGEIVYTTPGDGTAKVYLSLVDSNTDNPATATAWDSTVTYDQDDVITYSSVAYKSLINFNLNQTPTSSPSAWSSATTYSAGNSVRGSDGIKYTSIAGGNLNHDPTLDVSGTYWTNTGILVPWTTTIGGGSGSVKWLEIGGSDFPSGVSVVPIKTHYPVGAGPSTDTTSRNVFLLPANYLRRAPQDPKRGTAPLGGPSGLNYDDWLIEKPFLISRDPTIILRFVADITDVSKMDTLFCQAVATRIAFAVVDKVTQSLPKRQMVAKIYSEWKGRAHLVDGVEQGYEDPPDDDFIACRA
mgnify:CR=1 FL=1